MIDVDALEDFCKRASSLTGFDVYSKPDLNYGVVDFFRVRRSVYVHLGRHSFKKVFEDDSDVLDQLHTSCMISYTT